MYALSLDFGEGNTSSPVILPIGDLSSDILGLLVFNFRFFLFSSFVLLHISSKCILDGVQKDN